MWKAAMARVVDQLPGSDFKKPDPVQSDPFGDGFGDGFDDDSNEAFGDFGATEPPAPDVPDDDAVTYDYERLAGE
jgi:hypothetical protein